MYQWLDLLDKEIILYIFYHLRHPLLDKIMVSITSLGNYGIIWIIIIVMMIWIKKNRSTGLMITLTLILSGLIGNVLLKNIIQRPRPFVALELPIIIPISESFSMPSGHTLSSFAVAFIIVDLVKEKWLKTSVIILAAVISLSRVYLCVHYPTDIIAGVIIAFVISKGVILGVGYSMKNIAK